MPPHDVLAYLDLIAKRSEYALGALSGMELEEFLHNPGAQDTAFACNQDIGQALTQMSKHHPTHAERITDHRAIVASRNVMSHDLFSRDFEILWHDLTKGLPILYKEVRQMIDSIRAERERQE